MINMVRMDERLIHGQIAIKWSRVLGVNRIIVANDAAAASEIIQKSLMMAAPSTCKTAIKSVDDAIKLLNDPRMDTVKALVLVKNGPDMLKVLENVPNIEKVNIGNYGRVEPENPGYKRTSLNSQIYLDETEVPIFKEIVKVTKEKNIPCVCQTIPDDSPVTLEHLLG